ncbi:MAG: T9SS type A sorting domain-containing protein [Bacteroidia bacterium]|nr:T9SS type A sorting domain-containing protein [Bacteroidia bacterium]
MTKYLLKITAISSIILVTTFAKSQAPKWQLKCEYAYSQTWGSMNKYFDFDPANEQNGVIINNSSRMRFTSDGGKNWASEISKSQMEAVKYIGANKVLYAGYKNMYISNDGGQNFTKVTDTVPNETPYSIDNFGNFILIGNYAGRVSISKDGGSTWSNKRIIQNSQAFNIVRVLSANFAYAVASSNVAYTKDGGNTWSTITFPVSLSSGIFTFSAKDENNWILAIKPSNDQFLYKSDNAGSTWTEITAKLPKKGTPAKPVEINNIYAVADGKVFASIPNDINLYSSDFGNSMFVYDTIDASIVIDNRYFKTINNKVYQLTRFSKSGTTTFRIYTVNLGSQTSIGKNLNNEQNLLNVFPNPAADFVSFSNIPINSSICITDITGKVIYNADTNNEILEVNTSEFDNGVYCVKVFNKDYSISKRLVISR